MQRELINFDKKTTGQQILENKLKFTTETGHVRDYSKAMGLQKMEDLQDFVTEVVAAKLDKFRNKNIYFVLVINLDKMLNEPKFQVMPPRESCPTPVYKQCVWKYHHASGDLEFLWDIPAKERYLDIIRHPGRYLTNKAWKKHAEWVLMMESGELLKFAKKENGDKQDAIISLSPKE